MEEYDKLISENSHSFKFIDVPIILKVIKHSRGQCFYLNPKDKLATVEPTFQGSSSWLKIQLVHIIFRLDDWFEFTH